jgi:DNA replication and repair protein RecF
LFVRRIEVSEFRNLTRQTILLARGINFFKGGNGQGKTNVLEAVHLLATLRSFRSTSIKDVVAHDAEKAVISGGLDRDGIPIEMGLIIDQKGRRLSIGGRSVSKVDDYLGRLKVVSFTPDDLSMIKGAPSIRRRFLDRSAFLFQPSHLDQLKRFNAALKSRNRLLRDLKRQNREEIDVFSKVMALHGLEVSKARANLVIKVRQATKNIFNWLSDEKTEIDIIFKPGWRMENDFDAGQLEKQLRERTSADIHSGKTSIGPQHDDIEILVEDLSAKRFASQGQQRSCAVSILLAVVEQFILEEKEKPIIILDDVSSELDKSHRERLFEKLYEINSQVLMTSTEEDLLEGIADRIERSFLVKQGKLTLLR